MDIFNALIEISVYSGIIFLAVILLKKCFQNRMSPFMHYLIWMVLIVRLMMPVTIASPLHLLIIPPESHSQTADAAQLQTDAVASEVNESPAAGVQPQTADPTGTDITAPPVQTLHAMSLQQIIIIIWLAGAGVCLLYLSALYAALRKKFRRNYAYPSKKLRGLFEEVKAQMGIKANINLVCQYEYGTPSLMFPKTIMMPMDALAAMNDEQLKFTLRHELTHYKHGDQIINILLSLLNAVYWFNPFVWIAFRQLRKDMEMVCDSTVIKELDKAGRNSYASLIVNLFARPAHQQLVLGMSDSNVKKIAEKRVRRIYMKNTSKPGVKVIAALLAVVLFVCCFTTACQPTAAEEKKDAIAVANIDNADQSVAPASPQPGKYTAPETWNENYTSGSNKVNINASVVCPDFDSIDIMNMRWKDFTQEQADSFIKYFAGDAALYKGTYQDTKKDLEKMIADARQGINMTQQERDDLLGGMTAEDLQKWLNELNERYAAVLKGVKPKEVTSKFTTSFDGFPVIEVHTDNGGSNDVLFEVFNLAKSNTGAHFQARLRDGSAGGKILSYSGEPEEVANEVLSGLGILDNVSLRETMQGPASNNYTSNTENIKLVTNLTYDYKINGLPIREIKNQAPVKFPDKIYITVSEDGLTGFDWFNYAEVAETVQENVTLLPFEEIMQDFEENIFKQPLENNVVSSRYENDVVSSSITKIELCYVPIPENDSSGRYLQLVPAWNFYKGDTDPILTLSAVDGSMLQG